MDVLLRLIVVVALVGAIVALNTWYRRRARADAARRTDAWPALPDDVLTGAGAGAAGDGWVIFTTPVCAACRQVEAALHRERPDEHVVLVDVTTRPDLGERYDVRRAPTTLAVDAAGRVAARLVGVEDVVAHLRTVAA